MKKKVSILLDKEILEKAHELGINISKVCENTLKLYIQAIEQARKKEQAFLGEASFAKEGSVVRPPRFEPGSSAWQADVLDQTRLRPRDSLRLHG